MVTLRNKFLLNWIDKSVIIDPGEMPGYIALAKQGNRKAIEAVVRSCAKLAKQYAWKINGYRRNDIHELYAEALLGVMDAIEPFDLDAKVAFSTYAVFYIKRRLIAFIHHERIIFSVPINRRGAVTRATVIMRNANLGISSADDLDAQESRAKTKYMYVPSHSIPVALSLQSMLEDDATFDIPDWSDNTIQNIDADKLKALLHEFLTTLPVQHATFFRLYYGFPHGEQRLTHQEIADRFNTTRQHVQLSVSRALAKLRSMAQRSQRVRDIIEYMPKRNVA